MKELSLEELDLVAGGWQAQGSSGNDARNSPASGSNLNGGRGSQNGGNNAHQQWGIGMNIFVQAIGNSNSCTSNLLGDRAGNSSFAGGNSSTSYGGGRNNGNGRGGNSAKN
ncbi:hypothetical protein [Aeromonas veronii]|uniref:hypothetical protein n=1 Tax=Aeromonas veronii TaxID=654 RepID=UPI003BA1E05B